MWCNRPNYMSKEAFSKYLEDKRSKAKSDDNSRVKVSKDFRIALSAMMSDDDFKNFEDKFLGN